MCPELTHQPSSEIHSCRWAITLSAGLTQRWPDLRVEHGPPGPHEASKLSLSVVKSSRVLGWDPIWDFPYTIERTAGWYAVADAPSACASDIAAYVKDARQQGQRWAT